MRDYVNKGIQQEQPKTHPKYNHKNTLEKLKASNIRPISGMVEVDCYLKCVSNKKHHQKVCWGMSPGLPASYKTAGKLRKTF